MKGMRRWHRISWTLLAHSAFALLMTFSLASPTIASERTSFSTTMQSIVDGKGHPFGEPTAQISDRHVYDFANVLNSAEITAIESDASRLQRFDLAALIITVSADLSPDQASAIAASVRQDWNVESAEGADDGLVFLISIPAAEGARPIVMLSWGENALPHRGINRVLVEQIQQSWIDPWLDEPHVFESITYGLRRLIYHTIYDPAPAPPLTGTQETAQTIIAWTAPLAVIGFAGLRFVATSRERHPNPTSAIAPGWIRDAGVFIPALLLGIASVWAHSTIGVACTALLLIGALVAWVRRDPGDMSSRSATFTNTAGHGTWP